MKQSILKDKSFAFAVRIVKFTTYLRKECNEYVLSKQILRSGTAIGALVSEALFAQSKADFVSKLSISLKETNETIYWIELIHASELIDTSMAESLRTDAKELLALLISSVKTAKENNIKQMKNE